MNTTDRQPAVAGKFYPSDKTELQQTLESFFKKKSLGKAPLALIVPHAGYVFSGEVAAAAFAQIERDANFQRIFIIGSSHTTYFDGAAIYTKGKFVTPLGSVEVDKLAQELVDKYPNFVSSDIQPHLREHCLEVQLPMLQYWLHKPFKIVPIIIGGKSPKNCQLLAEALRPYFNAENLFVISSDFSHYPNYTDAKLSDNAMAEAIISNSAIYFLSEKKRLETAGLKDLATSACGWTSILTLLHITQDNPNLEFKKTMYRNSGDSKYGDSTRVVGYNAIAVFKKEVSFALSETEKQQLLQLARKTIANYLTNNKIEKLTPSNFSKVLQTKAGAFVTLKQKGALRGCIGTFREDQPLYQTIQSMAIASATDDPRFEAVKVSELASIDIEISVLTPMKKITSTKEIELGRHGIYIRKDGRSGTFLPQVATETGWNIDEFLGHCAQDKAGIGWDGWHNAELYTYETFVFGEHN